MTIFLIEDDRIYAEFIKKALSENPDYKIKLFTSAEDAYGEVKGKVPDVLIVDYDLPGMNGIDLYEKLKPRISNNQKVIMLSALDDGNMVLSFIQKGVRDYVIKDENVIESLKAILDGKGDDYLFD